MVASIFYIAATPPTSRKHAT
ncbi:UNVERIFIED_CONTAM: hypothetical protein GTU68_063359 [Idotea baltica]|nr:hypothetical protein [Idotea baltica]